MAQCSEQFWTAEKRVLLTALDDSGIQVAGTLRNASGAIVSVAVPIAIPLQTPVSLQISDRCSAGGVVIRCERQQDVHFAAIKMNAEDLRTEPRFQVDDPVRILVLSVPDFAPLDGTVSNISKSGIALRSDSAIPSGCAVKLEFSATVVLGEVRHCKRSDDGYSAGVQIESVFFRDEPTATDTSAAAAQPEAPKSVWSALVRLCKGVRD